MVGKRSLLAMAMVFMLSTTTLVQVSLSGELPRLENRKTLGFWPKLFVSARVFAEKGSEIQVTIEDDTGTLIEGTFRVPTLQVEGDERTLPVLEIPRNPDVDWAKEMLGQLTSKGIKVEGKVPTKIWMVKLRTDKGEVVELTTGRRENEFSDIEDEIPFPQAIFRGIPIDVNVNGIKAEVFPVRKIVIQARKLTVETYSFDESRDDPIIFREFNVSRLEIEFGPHPKYSKMFGDPGLPRILAPGLSLGNRKVELMQSLERTIWVGGVHGAYLHQEIDSDPGYEIIINRCPMFGTGPGIDVYDTDGTLLFTIPGCNDSCPAVGDTDGDGEVEIVVCTGTNQMLVYDTSGNPDTGSGFSVPGGCYDSDLSLADLDNDGDMEIIVGGSGAKVWYWDGSSYSTYPGWPNPSGSFNNPIVIGDVDSDNVLELFTTDYSRLYIWEQDGTEFCTTATGSNNETGPIGLDVDGDNYYEFFWNSSGNPCRGLVSYDHDCSLRFCFSDSDFDGQTFPSICDFDGNGSYEVAIHDDWCGGDLHLIDANTGTELPGFPVDLGSGYCGGSLYEIAPALGDVNGDGDVEIATYVWSPPWSVDGVVILNHDGTPLPGWPMQLNGMRTSNSHASDVLLADIDGDSRIEVVGKSSSEVRIWEQPGSVDQYIGLWVTNRGDRSRFGLCREIFQPPPPPPPGYCCILAEPKVSSKSSSPETDCHSPEEAIHEIYIQNCDNYQEIVEISLSKPPYWSIVIEDQSGNRIGDTNGNGLPNLTLDPGEQVILRFKIRPPKYTEPSRMITWVDFLTRVNLSAVPPNVTVEPVNCSAQVRMDTNVKEIKGVLVTHVIPMGHFTPEDRLRGAKRLQERTLTIGMTQSQAFEVINCGNVPERIEVGFHPTILTQTLTLEGYPVLLADELGSPIRDIYLLPMESKTVWLNLFAPSGVPSGIYLLRVYAHLSDDTSVRSEATLRVRVIQEAVDHVPPPGPSEGPSKKVIAKKKKTRRG